MPFPRPVPDLSEEEYKQFRRAMEAFDVPEHMEAELDKHREALRNES